MLQWSEADLASNYFQDWALPFAERASTGPERELEAMSVEELRTLLAQRQSLLGELEAEVQQLQGSPAKFDERLQQIEQLLHGVEPGTSFEIPSLLLQDFHKSAERDHALCDVAVDRRRLHQSQPSGPVSGKRSDAMTQPENSFVLGRGYMSMDQSANEQAQAAAELLDNRHPVIREMHYAGHIAWREDLNVAFANSDGSVDRRHLTLAEADRQFWLDVPQGGQPVSQESTMEMLARDPAAWSVARQDRPGQDEDALSIDWLGRAKRGLPFVKPSSRRPGGGLKVAFAGMG